MNRLTTLIILTSLLCSVPVDAGLWYDSDTTDDLQWGSRIPIILNETVGLERVNEPVLVSLKDINFSSIRVVDPQEFPDEEKEVGGNDIPYQINGDELLFLGNVNKRDIKTYYLYLSDDPLEGKGYPGSDLGLSYSRNGIVVENSKAVWEISSKGYYFSVNRYENKVYNSSITRSQGIDWGESIISIDGRDYFTAYGRNWNCSILDSGPLMIRINCSANSSAYRVKKVFSFFSDNAFFEVKENLEILDIEKEDVRWEIRNRVAPYFNQSGIYNFKKYESDKTFYMAARDTENGTCRYVFWVMGKGDFRDIGFRNHRDRDSFDYSLYPSDRNATGIVRYLFREGSILGSMLEYERFIKSLATLESMEKNSISILDIPAYDRFYDKGSSVVVQVRGNQVYGTSKASCRIGDKRFALYDDGTHGDLYEFDSIWTNSKSFEITDETPTGEYGVYCEAVDHNGNVVSDSYSFPVFDRGSYHNIVFSVESIKIRPSGTGRTFINVTNTGNYREYDVSFDIEDLPEGWERVMPEKFDLEVNESMRIPLELRASAEYELGSIPLTISARSRDAIKSIKKFLVDVELFNMEIETDVEGDTITLRLLEDNENPVTNANVVVTQGNESSSHTTDENGYLLFQFEEIGSIGINAEKTGYKPLSLKIGLREKEVSYWFPVTALIIVSLTLLIARYYWKSPDRDQMENAIVISLVIGIFITLIWVGFTMRGKEPFTALYFAEDSYSNYLEGNSTKFRYVVDCWEHKPTKYELSIFLGNRLAEVDEFWLGEEDRIRVMKLEREKIIEVPKDLELPAKVRLVLRTGDKSYDIHYFLRERIYGQVNETVENLTCLNGILDPDETGIDCGGSCMPCDDEDRCDSHLDCLSGFCFKRTCKEPTCSDGIKNQGETGIDCGGQCRPCHCFNDVLDLDETDLDCGGSCQPCEEEMLCLLDSDCSSGFCFNGSCGIPTCRDEIQNQGETGIDCGGPCKPCPSCSDGIRNQGEIDVDCGGPCPECDFLYENGTHVSWIGQVDGFVSSVRINSDGSYIVVASNSDEGYVTLFDNSSLVRWISRTLYPLTDVRFTVNERFITPYPRADLYLFDLNGVNRMYELADKIENTSLVCGISRGSDVFFRFNRTENRWSYNIPFDIHRIAFTENCSHRVVSQRDNENLSSVRLFENDRLLWGYSVDGDIYSVSVSDNANYIVVGAGGRKMEEDNFIYLFDKKKRLLWRYKADWNIYGLSISGDGGFILAGSRRGRVYLLDKTGGLLWEYDSRSSILDLDMTSDGKHLVFVTAAGGIYFVTNPLFNCSDGIRNQGETDIDCGGPCPPCEEGRGCLRNVNCLSGFCFKGICTTPTCDDGIKNQGETGIDCGGPCLPCRPICYRDSDCGKDFVSEPYCYEKYILRDYVTCSCVNPGTVSSYCETVNETRVEELCLGDLECREGRCVSGS